MAAFVAEEARRGDRGVGRPKIDPALQLRDAYLAWSLCYSVGCSFSELERCLYPRGTFARREIVGGFSQPNSFSRAASLKRPLPSALLALVERYCPELFISTQSILWAVLSETPVLQLDWLSSDGSRSRGSELQTGDGGYEDLSHLTLGIRRLGRLTSLGALGAILWRGSMGPDRHGNTALADDCAIDIFRRLMLCDPAFFEVGHQISRLIDAQLDDRRALDLYAASMRARPMIRQRPRRSMFYFLFDPPRKIFQGAKMFR